MMSLLKPAWPWGFWVRNREAPTFLASLPQFQSWFYHLLPHHKTQTVSLWSLCYTKEPLSPEYKVPHLSPIASLSLRGFLYERNQLPVLTHHELRGTQPTQSAQSSTALSDIIGSFGFSLCLCLPPISAWSIGHCPFSILGAKLIEEQFSALLNNGQWHFSAVLDPVIRQPNSKCWPQYIFCLKTQKYIQSFQ